MNQIDSENVQVQIENSPDNVADRSFQPPKKLIASRMWLVAFAVVIVLGTTITVIFLIPSTNINSQSIAMQSKKFMTTESAPFANIQDQDENHPAHTSSQSLNSVQIQTKSEMQIESQMIALLNETRMKLTDINEGIISLNQHYEVLEPINDQLALILMNQNEITGDLNARISNLQTSIEILTNQVSIESTPKIDPSNEIPPFRLVSIDLWNNTWYAVLELEGIVTMIEPSAVRAGWQLVSVDPPSQSAKFLSDSGKEVRLSVKG